jgi:elongation factor Ts
MKLGEDMEIKIEDVKKLRDMTGAGMMAAKNALVEAKGDMEKAVEVLRLAGQASAAKKADREARNGVITSYIHGDRIGVLVEINCETDFVARTDDFKDFARDIAMQIAASNPEYVSPEDIPETVIEKEKEIYRAEMDGQNKPAEVIEKIVDGKLGKYYETVCLTHQAFVKDPDKKVDDLTKAMIAKLGENIVIRRFERLELGGN